MRKIYIWGAGAIGIAFAANLSSQGKDVTFVRSSIKKDSEGLFEVEAENLNGEILKQKIPMISADSFDDKDGISIVTAKSFANQGIASKISKVSNKIPIVIIQNGLNVENPFKEKNFENIFRCIVYTTSEKISLSHVKYRPIMPNPIGVVSGSENLLKAIVEIIETPNLRFAISDKIQVEIWSKAIINSAFNSICPLINIDNGIFHRDENAMKLAEELVVECIKVALAVDVNLDKKYILESILRISKMSDGQLISTLQDINNNRKTEIETLNCAIAKISNDIGKPELALKTRMLGEMILLKSSIK
jgi:2-dehydropantoate 2-reductase